ncbi:glycoside hydrolase family 15 protein [Terrabacter sp. MAHUQ-38]|uniref:glycoside hydrolase family 15 protein n=1 Tax=unclassified Terrabacter TaxID=2630222 RepID=UPI00165D769B|nr:glycoside hydrolase family 15 protein [Terrabacter sp. MAHUQ-38]MBC9822914.1 glycoside hydrolase family 15 protein [Terrabacter sp. MAHUQ-38]
MKRDDGYAPLRSYAAIGDGRTVALVAEDGAIDWLAVPSLDSPSMFAALLDAGHGGCLTVTPTATFEVSRRYLPGTNVLETTFTTTDGVVRLLDAMSLNGGSGLSPLRELQRRVEGVAGHVVMSWRARPRFGDGQRPTQLARRYDIPVFSSGADAIAICAFDAGEIETGSDWVGGTFETCPGSEAVIALCAAHQEPLIFPAREELDERYATTLATWRAWQGGGRYEGPWQDPVARSALALKLLVHAPSGALAAAATTSLPEDIGGVRNWDYRFCWVRDAAFTLDALLRLGCAPEAQAYFWWLMHASQLTRPRLQPLYRLDGGAFARERTLPLPGYRASRPVRVGNAAAAQLQLDTYGELLQTAWLYAGAGHRVDADIGRRLAQVADLVCHLWGSPDAGIWEVRSEPVHFTHSKMMCWVALDRAGRLAEQGLIPARHKGRWHEQAAAVADFIERECYSSELKSYVRFAGGEELDASVLLGLLSGYGDARSPRWADTVAAVRRELGHGCYVRRYSGGDGLSGGEGAFISCSFWLAEALARTGSVSEATALMDELVALANDVGLYAEEIDPATGAFLGNLPQALSHLSLISAALTIAGEKPR